MFGNINFKEFIFICIIPIIFSACNPALKINEGEYLLYKSKVIDKSTKLDKSEIESYIKQKPNRKLFKIFRFHLWLHNLVNEKRLQSKRNKFNKRKEKRNATRVSKGKSAKKFSRQLFGEWLLNISESPVIYDSMLAKKSSKQITSFLNNKGYFISSVHDSVYFGKRRNARVYYKITASKPYTITKVDYKIQDEIVKYFVFADTTSSFILPRSVYDVDILQKERERITANLKNEGYFLFTKEYIYFEIDTNFGNKKVNVTIGIKNFEKQLNDLSDSIVESPHQRFQINNIYIETNFIAKKNSEIKKDTLNEDDYFFVFSKKLKFKTSVLLDAIFFRKGELFQQKKIDDTYKRLQELKSFKIININFIELGGNYLDCVIQLSPVLKQSFTTETEGNNTSGNLGIGANFVYQNRNLLRGAEVLELKFKGSLEAQKIIDNSSSINPTKQFNTVEIGPEGNIYIPRFLLPFKVDATKRNNPKTIITSSFIYQRRTDYSRYITNISIGYTWKETATKRHTINPLVINFVRVYLEPAFYNYLNNEIHNIYILNSFSNHLSTSTRYSYTYNEQEVLHGIGNYSYFKFNAESSGNILRGVYNLANSIHENTLLKDDAGRYNLAGIVYSQYLRADADFRYYYFPNELNKVVWRVAAGIGKPLINFPALPFERSFYSGGSNGIRAWRARTLGPGSYSNNGEFNFDQFGDGQLELNLEYRVKIIKQLNGAFFIDAGNTWLRQPDASRPGGDFQANRFYKEIAIGSGIGVRADFNFFIIRFDLGVKIRDPQFAESKRWIIKNINNNGWKNNYRESHRGNKYGFLAFNIGIGYPF